MKDRVPTKPGRVLLTPENGSAPFYAVMTRADEPTQEGDPLNKNTLLKDATAARFGLGPEAVPDDVFLASASALFTLLDNITVEKIAESATWVAPKSVLNKFFVFICGGGGGGSASSQGGGGGSGHIVFGEAFLEEGTEVDIVIGAGGTANYTANPGGTSSFGDYLTAEGGEGADDGNGGAGGAGGGGSNGKGGDGSFGGGGGGRASGGGNGGTYGGGGGTVSDTGVPGTGGLYGGDGGSKLTASQKGTCGGFMLPALLVALHEGITPYNSGGIEQNGAGGGGFGGSGGTGGGTSGQSGGGGGGYGCNGGNSKVVGAGGGGGLFTNGRNASDPTNTTYTAGGGGGMFGYGSGGYGGSGYTAGDAGACFIVYQKED